MPARRFTDEQEIEIGKVYLAGKSTRQIARDFGIDKTCIISALRRQHIEQRDPSARNRLYNVNAHVFDTIDTEEKAYWYGFLWADGYISREKTLVVGLQLRDKDHLEKIKSFTESEAPLIDRINKIGEKEYGRAEFMVTDKHLGKRLLELGLKSHRLHDDPAIIFSSVPKHLIRHWIRGYIDGDGSIFMSRGRINLNMCGGEELLRQIRDEIREGAGGGNGHIYKHIKSNIYYLSYSHKTIRTDVLEWINKDSTIQMDRKWNK